MTQTGEPNSIHESPVLILQSDRSKVKDISIRTQLSGNKDKTVQNKMKQNKNLSRIFYYDQMLAALISVCCFFSFSC